MVRIKFIGPGVCHGLTIDLRKPIEDVHLNAYAELGIFYVGGNLVIELSDSDEEAHNEEGHEGEEQDNNMYERDDEEERDEELPIPPLQLVDEDIHEREDEEGG